jgi:hypothetical protein
LKALEFASCLRTNEARIYMFRDSWLK